MKIPTPVISVATKAGNWLVKNGPKIMSIGGGLMAVGGAVMACEATLHADEVLDKHKQRMTRIQAAKELSDGPDTCEPYTDKMMKHDKAVAYFETGVDFIRLYAPAFTVGIAGVGMMQAAFWVNERRRATAVAALTTMDQMYQNLIGRTQESLPGFSVEENPKVVKALPDEDGAGSDKLVLDPDSEPDPFFFIFDETNPNWYNKNAFLLNERFLTATIDAFNYRLSAHSVGQVWVNDILKAWNMPEKDLGYFYGWNAATGDIIDYDVVPFLKIWDDDDSSQMPMLVETDMATLRELESNDIQEGYCIGIRLKSSSDGYDDVVQPRFIYNEVYGK